MKITAIKLQQAWPAWKLQTREKREREQEWQQEWEREKKTKTICYYALGGMV